jgi:hypothetical protein
MSLGQVNAGLKRIARNCILIGYYPTTWRATAMLHVVFQ